MKFTQAYSACTVCSPTRASLMTGKYPARLRVTDWIPGRPPANPKLLVPEWTKFLPHEEITLAEVFKAAGYATASIGKWHLGPETHYPETHGFEVNVAGTHLGSPTSGYFAPWKIPTVSEGADGDYLTDRMGDRSRALREGERPARLLPLPASLRGAHADSGAEADLVEEISRAGETGRAAHESHLRRDGRKHGHRRGPRAHRLGRAGDRRTARWSIFTSDNGGHLPTTSNVPLRVGKGSCYEGGTRVPLIVRWPGVVSPGSSSDTPVITPDIYPTLLAITGVAGVPAHRPDGESLEPLLRRRGGLKRDALYWHYPHYQLYQQGGTVPYAAIRAGDFKLIEFYDGRPAELYDLRQDIGETRNLATAMPERFRELHERLERWRKDVNAQLPKPNPSYDPAKPEHQPAPGKKG